MDDTPMESSIEDENGGTPFLPEKGFSKPCSDEDENGGTPFLPEKGFSKPCSNEDENGGTPFIPEEGFYQPWSDEDGGTFFIPEKGFDQPCLDEVENGGTPFIPEKGFYQPCSDESWDSYQALISILEDQFGGFPRHVLCGAADEVLSVLKSEIFPTPMAKKTEMEKLFGPITIDTYNQIVMVSDWINDYRKNPQNQSNDLDEVSYNPTTEENWRNYHLFLDVIKNLIKVNQPDIVLLRLTADGVLTILKNEAIEVDLFKKEGIEYNLGKISNEEFDNLKHVGGLITDFKKPQQLNHHHQDIGATSSNSSRFSPHFSNLIVEGEDEKIDIGETLLRMDDDQEMGERGGDELGNDYDDDDEDDDDDDNDIVDADNDIVDADYVTDEVKKLEINEEIEVKVESKCEEDDEDWVMV